MLGAAALVGIAAYASLVSPARAQDFFSMLFGGMAGRPPLPPPPLRAPPPDEPRFSTRSSRVHASRSEGDAWCVRTCDGRYFPIPAPDSESRAQLCTNFCPASETKLVYGDNIEDATDTDGRSYSELPNAFRYRTQMVAGCTCNGKDQAGLAPIKIEDDPTLRSGDIVADNKGLMVANLNANKHGVALNLSPIPEKMRARLRHVRVMAKE